MASNAWATCSPFSTPTVTSALSAPWPLVTLRPNSAAYSMLPKACVAPSSMAFSALERHRVDGDDVARPGVRGTLDRVDADAADAHDDHRVTGPDLTGLDRRAPPGADAAADQAGHLERDLLGDLHGGADVDRGDLGEGAQAAHLADRVAVAGVEPEALGVVPAAADQEVSHRKSQMYCWPLAQYRQRPQPGEEREDDVVALLEALRARAHRGDHAGALVAAEEGVLADREVPGGDVVVGVAQPGGGQLDLELAGLRVVDDQVHDLVLAGAERMIAPRVLTGTETSSSPSPSRAVRRMRGHAWLPLARYGAGITRG
jgi:hypothetical protein